MEKQLKISIITASYNSAETIRDTFESVLSQKYDNYEYIIIDGKSKDNTIDIIKEYESKFKGKMKYISEKDNGLYDAMNKGIKMATGDVIGLLNSDDYYKDENVLSLINKNIQEADGVYGNLIMLEDKIMNIPERKLASGKGNYRLGWAPLHPTFYVRKKVYDENGQYNQKYPIAADYDFMIRVLKNKNYKFQYINEALVCMRPGGASTNGLKGRFKGVKEVYEILKINKERPAFIITILKFFRGAFKALQAKIIKK